MNTIFIASRLSNGNGLFPTEIRIETNVVTIVKPGLISCREKSIKYNKLTSVEIVSPLIGFSKIIISAYQLDDIKEHERNLNFFESISVCVISLT